MKIPKNVVDAFEKEKYVQFGTCSKKGIPNVVIIGFQRIINDDTIQVFDTHFGKTKQNILENENVAICIFHTRDQTYQIKGKAKYITSKETFEKLSNWAKEKGKTKPTVGIVEIKVTEIYDLNPTYETAGKKIL